METIVVAIVGPLAALLGIVIGAAFTQREQQSRAERDSALRRADLGREVSVGALEHAYIPSCNESLQSQTPLAPGIHRAHAAIELLPGASELAAKYMTLFHDLFLEQGQDDWVEHRMRRYHAVRKELLAYLEELERKVDACVPPPILG